MNSPDPIKPPDPTTPGARPPPSALGGAAATVATGLPLGAFIIWLLETYGTAHGQPLKLDSITANVIGSVGAGLSGYLYQLAMALLAIAREKAGLNE